MGAPHGDTKLSKFLQRDFITIIQTLTNTWNYDIIHISRFLKFPNASSMCDSKVSQASNLLENTNFPKTFLAHSKFSSVFIHAFEDDAMKQREENSWFNTFMSRIASLKTITGLIFVLSALAAKHTDTQDFS